GSRTSRGPIEVGGSSSRRGGSSLFSSSGTSGRVGLSRYPAREPSPVSPQPPYRCRPPSSRRRLSNPRPLHQSLRELRAPRERYLRTSGPVDLRPVFAEVLNALSERLASVSDADRKAESGLAHSSAGIQESRELPRVSERSERVLHPKSVDIADERPDHLRPPSSRRG